MKQGRNRRGLMAGIGLPSMGRWPGWKKDLIWALPWMEEEMLSDKNLETCFFMCYPKEDKSLFRSFILTGKMVVSGMCIAKE